MEVATNEGEPQNEGLLKIAQEFAQTNQLLFSTVTELETARRSYAPKDGN